MSKQTEILAPNAPINVALPGGSLVLMDKETIKSEQDKIKVNLANVDQSIHENMIQCLLHAKEHGDTSLARRLLIDTLDGKNTGYRVQGLINAMRKFSPLELKEDNINLSGTMTEAQAVALMKAFPELDGKLAAGKRPFLIEQFAKTYFWKDSDNNERVAVPVYQETMVSPILRVVKDFDLAMENTVNGKPVNAAKKFYDGIHADQVAEAMSKIKEIINSLPKDSTWAVRKAQQEIAEKEEFVRSSLSETLDGAKKVA